MISNKDFFLETLNSEVRAFREVIAALPQDKVDYKPEGMGRSAGSLADQLANQWSGIAAVIRTGSPGGEWGSGKVVVSEVLTKFDKNMEELRKALKEISDEGWEQGVAIMEFPGGKWETTKYGMTWGFLFDGIHHRGQLSTCLRAMGAKVPSIYGPSADTKM